jgi:hypothetical protein
VRFGPLVDGRCSPKSWCEDSGPGNVRGRIDGLMGVVMLLYAHMFGITTSRNLVFANSEAGRKLPLSS